MEITTENIVKSATFWHLAGANRETRRVMIQEVTKNITDTYKKYVHHFPDMTATDIAAAIHSDTRNADFFEKEAECQRILDAYPKLKSALFRRNTLWNTLAIAILFSFDQMFEETFEISYEEKAESNT